MTTSTPPRPSPGEYAPFYAGYIASVPEGDVLRELATQRDTMRALVATLDGEAASSRYAPDKWSIKGVVGHLSDAERIFAVRALRIARGDETPLPGWDENDYARAAHFDRRTIASLAAEWDSARSATLTLFDSFDGEAWDRRGIANGNPVSVRAIAYIVAGHTAHHLGILRDRYGLKDAGR